MPRVRARSPAFLSILILFSGTECVRGVSLIRRLPTLSVWSLGGAVLRHTFLVRPVEFSPVGRELSTGLVLQFRGGRFWLDHVFTKRFAAAADGTSVVSCEDGGAMMGTRACHRPRVRCRNAPART